MKYVPHSTLNSKWTHAYTVYTHIYILYAIKQNFDQFVCRKKDECAARDRERDRGKEIVETGETTCEEDEREREKKNEISARIFLCFLVSYFLHILKYIKTY